MTTVLGDVSTFPQVDLAEGRPCPRPFMPRTGLLVERSLSASSWLT